MEDVCERGYIYLRQSERDIQIHDELEKVTNLTEVQEREVRVRVRVRSANPKPRLDIHEQFDREKGLNKKLSSPSRVLKPL